MHSPAVDMFDSHSDLSSANNSGSESLVMSLTATNLKKLGAVKALDAVQQLDGPTASAAGRARSPALFGLLESQAAEGQGQAVNYATLQQQQQVYPPQQYPTTVYDVPNMEFSFPTTYAPTSNRLGGSNSSGGGGGNVIGGAYRSRNDSGDGSSKPPTPTGSLSGFGADSRANSGTLGSDLNYSGSNAGDSYVPVRGQSPVLSQMQAMHIQPGPPASQMAEVSMYDHHQQQQQFYQSQPLPPPMFANPSAANHTTSGGNAAMNDFDYLQQRMLAMDATDQQLVLDQQMQQQQQQQGLGYPPPPQLTLQNPNGGQAYSMYDQRVQQQQVRSS